ncbi:MAG: hypothetical protein ABJB39_08525, partial [Chloroflexota bacterium]
TTFAPTSRTEPTAKTEPSPETQKPTTNVEQPVVAPKTEKRTEPQKPTTNVEALVKECLTKYAAAKNGSTAPAAASEACRRAIEASGLTTTSFWARFAPKAESSTEPVKPSATVEALVKVCFEKYTAAKNSSTTGATAASEACHRAIEASGLTATEFWTKFGTPQAPRSEPKPSATPTTQLSQLTRYCLTMHAALTTTSTHEQVERATAVCNQAIAESKLTPTEFWSKFGAYR